MKGTLVGDGEERNLYLIYKAINDMYDGERENSSKR